MGLRAFTGLTRTFGDIHQVNNKLRLHNHKGKRLLGLF